VLAWLFFFFVLCAFGVSFVVCASIGNDVYVEDWRWPALGLLTVTVLTVVPFAIANVAGEDDASVEQSYLRLVSFGLGSVVVVFHLIHIASLTVSKKWQRRLWIRKLLNPSALYSEYNLKKASACKLNNLVQNAMDLIQQDTGNNDFVITSNFGRALFEFSKHGSRLEPAGGILWTLRGAWSKVLYSEEGIWYSARILASNICQYIVSLYLIVGGFTLSAHVAENYDEAGVTSKFVNFVVDTNVNGFDDSALQQPTMGSLNAAASDLVMSLYPKENYTINIPLVVGVLIAFAVAVNLSVNFLPSVTSTILKLRCGVIPVQGSPFLQQYRASPDSVAILIG